VGKFTRSEVASLRAANPRMAKWSDAKVLRVCNRARRKQEKKLAKKRKK
jgi:hypothetical protein